MKYKKSFLFLQGSYSRFTRNLASALESQGHEFLKISFYGGDRYFWGNDNAIDYTGDVSNLEEFYMEIIEKHGITDIVLFNDSRPVHTPAIKVAHDKGLNVYVMEEAYFRPHWINLEWGGMNGNSYLSRNPEWYRERAQVLPDLKPVVPVGNAHSHRVRNDIMNTIAMYALKLKYNKYKTHRPYSILHEYLFWAKRLTHYKRNQAEAMRVINYLAKTSRPYFLLPLQLDTDVQTRIHSHFGGMVPALTATMYSFAKFADPDDLLVIKNHPLDNGMINYHRIIANKAREYDIEGRVSFIDGGNLEQIISQSKGVTLINSTVGLTALNLGKPVIALGKAVYDIPGVTFQDNIDHFWHNARESDPSLWQDLRKVILSDTMVNGNFYTEEGMSLAIANALPRLAHEGCIYGQIPPSPLREAPMPNRINVPQS
jgi:capsular polysaccharide export protein